MSKTVEDLMYQLSDIFMFPVLVLLLMLFAYSLFVLGALGAEAWQRKSNADKFRAIVNRKTSIQEKSSLKGFPLLTLANYHPDICRDELDVAAFKLLEGVRTVSRLAPMLGLIATMIPMGPALKSLADGNVQGISENLVVAFSAVIFGLVIASITFWVASVRKRWLASELVAVLGFLQLTKPVNREGELNEAA
ncbi:hypothetical protein TDB9533_04106 [Thalassocella blandensis]|nr:hypothetical protein TDB9533_04106 [Thalassocella blandensis]